MSDAIDEAGPRGNFYSGVGLDRADHLRRDAGWLEARLADPGSCLRAR